ncbi:hypothetical protein BpHYR1_037763 [Brachionus plicatilis]|uniref:Uncharacterized protein n=1 Tax=Brachionus plicatilis TaxID=10195 RepID=A0A3M7RAF3_BRAPC|nr:hypothetical protein BpHYR1_037763 [Brachionus plicatilis]
MQKIWGRPPASHDRFVLNTSIIGNEKNILNTYICDCQLSISQCTLDSNREYLDMPKRAS